MTATTSQGAGYLEQIRQQTVRLERANAESGEAYAERRAAIIRAFRAGVHIDDIAKAAGISPFAAKTCIQRGSR